MKIDETVMAFRPEILFLVWDIPVFNGRVYNGKLIITCRSGSGVKPNHFLTSC